MDPIVIGLLVVLAMNMFMFPIAYKLQTDKLTDITYAMSFATIAIYGFIYGSGGQSVPKFILTFLILAWAVRLGFFLLIRVSKMGKDDRFDEIRTSPKRFFRFFLIQAVSSWIISLPFLYRLIDNPSESHNINQVLSIEWIGFGIAVVGLIIESVADSQKSKYKFSDGKGVFMGGLYQKIRYPNYLGEILFWIGIFIVSIHVLSGFRWISLISPIVIILLLRFLSGIPIIEKSRHKKYGDDPSYLKYLKETKLLIPGIY
ncbi:MAG: steroid 5-alpha reductase family enzyme [Saprospiraceae bacterium]|jgi:steroid 5-alpha reductase family enzyme